MYSMQGGKKIIHFTAVVSVHSSLSWYVAAEQDLNFLGGGIGTIEAKSCVHVQGYCITEKLL